MGPKLKLEPLNRKPKATHIFEREIEFRPKFWPDPSEVAKLVEGRAIARTASDKTFIMLIFACIQLTPGIEPEPGTEMKREKGGQFQVGRDFGAP